jgi:hypothetical protein
VQLATLARWAGDWTSARRCGQQAFDAARESGRKDLMSRAANSVAGVYVSQLELDRAEELATEARRLAEEGGGIVGRGQARNWLANVAELSGRYTDAIPLCEQSIALFAEAGRRPRPLTRPQPLAGAIMARGENERAEQLARGAIRILKPLGHPIARGTCGRHR